MRYIILILLALTVPVAAFAPDPAMAAAERSQPAPATLAAAARTGKERLSDKASDEQRIDDCKVPQARRTRARSPTCPWDIGS
jgi:hypothetical protein